MAAGEFFDIEAQEIVLFGTPWHGPVQDGTLTLPNESTMTYPQPSDQATRNAGDEEECDYYDAAVAGTSHLIAIPGLPAVARTTEEAAADAAAGRQWKNRALLSGGRMQLYGHPLTGWIYVDPAGDRWLVTCPDFWPYPHLPVHAGESALETTVRLTRFGILPLGGDLPDPETYDYEVSLAAGWVTLPLGTPALHRTVDAITRTGNKAVIGLHVGAGHPDLHGALEVTISGAGDDATVALSVLRTFAECHASSRSETQTDSGGNPRTLETTVEGEFSLLLALWYDEDDAIVEVRAEGTLSESSTHVGEYTLAGSPPEEYTSSATSTTSGQGSGEVTISVAGTVVETFTLARSHETSNTWSQASYNDPGEWAGAEWSGEVSLNEWSFADSGTGPPTTEYDPGGAAGTFGSSQIVDGTPPGIGSALFYVVYGGGAYPWENSVTVFAFAHSRHCIGLLRHDTTTSPETSTWTGLPAYTPTGAAGEEVELSGPPAEYRRRDEYHPSASGLMYYGAYDWLSGDVTLWQEEPVCYV